MPSADLQLQDLAQRLAQKQAELEEARRAYEARLAALAARKTELEAQLRVVEAEIRAVGKTAPAAAPGKKGGGAGKAAPTAAAPARPGGRRGMGSMRELLLKLLAKSTRPIKAKELAELAQKAGYQTQSKDFVNVSWVALGKMDDL